MWTAAESKSLAEQKMIYIDRVRKHRVRLFFEGIFKENLDPEAADTPYFRKMQRKAFEVRSNMLLVERLLHSARPMSRIRLIHSGSFAV
jgi:hypothetical protein